MRNESLVERVCESFYSKDLTDCLKSVRKLRNMGELRFDLSKLSLNDLSEIRKATSKELIFTCRTDQISNTDAIKAYQKAIEVGFDFIDIDFSPKEEILKELKSLRQTKLILSYHNYDKTPDLSELKTISELLVSSRADIIKIACMLKSKEDILILEKQQEKYDNAIFLGMGEWAVESRIRSILAGAPFTYLALNNNQATAKGQVGFEDFQSYYHQFRGETKLRLAVLGRPVLHSKSPDLFQKFFEDDKLNGVYEKIELDNINEIEILKKHFDGFNITAPFKQSIIPYLDELSISAKKIRAVNTVYQRNGKWMGDNTDHTGILEAIKSKINPSEVRNCLIIGAGGAARAAAFVMKQSKIKSVIINRTFPKAKILAKEFNAMSIEVANLEDYHLIINTIPEPFSLIKAEKLNSDHIVLDAIYPDSAFTGYTSEIDFELILGEVWLEKQALEAYRIFKNE